MSGARPDTWMPWYLGDYFRDTLHLTTEQHGAYLLLIAACWMRGGVLPDDDGQLAAIARLPPKRWAATRAIIMAFFKPTDGGFTQKRAAFELEKAKKLSEARSATGKMGGRPKANEKLELSECKANGKLGETPSPKDLRTKEEFKDLVRVAVRRPSEPGPDFTDPETRKAGWETSVANEIRRTLPEDEAQQVIAAYADGDKRAKAVFEQVSQRIKARRAA